MFAFCPVPPGAITPFSIVVKLAVAQGSKRRCGLGVLSSSTFPLLSVTCKITVVLECQPLLAKVAKAPAISRGVTPIEPRGKEITGCIGLSIPNLRQSSITLSSPTDLPSFTAGILRDWLNALDKEMTPAKSFLPP